MENEPQSSTGQSAGKRRAPTVLQVVPALDAAGGGVERGTVEIARALAAGGWRAIVASAGGEMAYQIERAGGEHVTLPVDSKQPWTMWRNVARLADLAAARQVDLIHARSRAPAWSARQAARQVKAPFVTTVHAPYPANSGLKRLYNGIMGKGDRVIAISDFVADYARTALHVPAENLATIHRGVDTGYFNPAAVSAERLFALARRWRLPDGLPTVLMPGRLTRLKGHHVLIEALSSLQGMDILTLIVGGDQGRRQYREELEAAIRSHGLEGSVRLLDACNDMPAAYMLADVVVSPSTVPEGFGRVAAEAQAMGRPVIASNHGGARETVLEGETGWLVRPGDAADLAAALSVAITLSAGERAAVAERARRHVAENFTVERMCARTLEVYASLIWPS
ncbi:glycosyltransferase family 4 protein [Oceanibacterium hippocampi]|uniref:Spore coat protein SA n=1 Tax=Oceanibacterium hippocampi TaxID=745714 RepID=A0A1Y5RRI3_9PROT|nr:glycosyltransferase family 4 protein [Oceanibacterium hippocampi]SLN23569.1 Spore coat protein SA [Oceanibacterium hippocampi]